MKNIWAIGLGLFLMSGLSYGLTFKDVPVNHWAHDAVYSLVRRGIADGYADNTFRGEAPINRYSLSVFLNNAIILLEKKIQDSNDLLQQMSSRNIKASPSSMGEIENQMAGMQGDMDLLKADSMAIQDSLEKLRKNNPKNIPIFIHLGIRADKNNSSMINYTQAVEVKAIYTLSSKQKVTFGYDSTYVPMTAPSVPANNSFYALFNTITPVFLEEPLDWAFSIGPGEIVNKYVYSLPGTRVNVSTFVLGGISLDFLHQVKPITRISGATMSTQLSAGGGNVLSLGIKGHMVYQGSDNPLSGTNRFFRYGAYGAFQAKKWLGQLEWIQNYDDKTAYVYMMAQVPDFIFSKAIHEVSVVSLGATFLRAAYEDWYSDFHAMDIHRQPLANDRLMISDKYTIPLTDETALVLMYAYIANSSQQLANQIQVNVEHHLDNNMDFCGDVFLLNDTVNKTTNYELRSTLKVGLDL